MNYDQQREQANERREEMLDAHHDLITIKELEETNDTLQEVIDAQQDEIAHLGAELIKAKAKAVCDYQGGCGGYTSAIIAETRRMAAQAQVDGDGLGAMQLNAKVDDLIRGEQ
jgi:hypothetical protein